MVKVVSFDGANVEQVSAVASEWFGETDDDVTEEMEQDVEEAIVIPVKPIEGGRVISRRIL